MPAVRGSLPDRRRLGLYLSVRRNREKFFNCLPTVPLGVSEPEMARLQAIPAPLKNYLQAHDKAA
jgi:hypothetical protein